MPITTPDNRTRYWSANASELTQNG